jgi:pantoate--beta-alanine ligase
MATDLGLCGSIVGVPTVRDADGLALSSRNALLSADERRRALALPQCLERAREAIAEGSAVSEALEAAKRELQEAGFAPIDYVALVDAETLEPVETARPGLRLIAAATVGSTRLIDNLPVGENAIPGR